MRSYGLWVIAVRWNDTDDMHTDLFKGGSTEVVHLD
jgi:hypothetical protein